MAMIHKTRLFTFLKQEKMTDVTLTAEGKSIQAHKLILAAASSYFEDLFVILKDRHPVIVLKDVPVKYLVLMLEYIYCGQVELEPEDVRTFNDVAKSLKINVDFKIADEEGVSSSKNDVGSMLAARDEKFDESFDSVQSQVETPVKITKSETKGNRTLPSKLISKRKRDKDREMLSKSESWPSCQYCKRAMGSRYLPYHKKHCWKNPNRIVTECKICKHSVDIPSRLSLHMKNKHPEVVAAK